MPTRKKTEPARAAQDESLDRPRLTTIEAVNAANVAFLKQVFQQKRDKNCSTAQAIASTALERAQTGEKFNRGREKGAVGLWRALANEYAPICQTFDAFVEAIEHDKKVDEIAGDTLYLANGKRIRIKSLRQYFTDARRECAKRG